MRIILLSFLLIFSGNLFSSVQDSIKVDFKEESNFVIPSLDLSQFRLSAKFEKYYGTTYESFLNNVIRTSPKESLKAFEAKLRLAIYYYQDYRFLTAYKIFTEINDNFYHQFGDEFNKQFLLSYARTLEKLKMDLRANYFFGEAYIIDPNDSNTVYSYAKFVEKTSPKLALELLNKYNTQKGNDDEYADYLKKKISKNIKTEMKLSNLFKDSRLFFSIVSKYQKMEYWKKESIEYNIFYRKKLFKSLFYSMDLNQKLMDEIPLHQIDANKNSSKFQNGDFTVSKLFDYSNFINTNRLLLDYSVKYNFNSEKINTMTYHFAYIRSFMDVKSQVLEMQFMNKELSSIYTKHQQIFSFSYMYERKNWNSQVNIEYKLAEKDETVQNNFLVIDKNDGFNINGSYGYHLFEDLSVGLFVEFFDYKYRSIHYYSPNSLLRFGVISNFNYQLLNNLDVDAANILGFTNDNNIYENLSVALNLDLKFIVLFCDVNFVSYNNEEMRSIGIYIKKDI